MMWNMLTYEVKHHIKNINYLINIIIFFIASMGVAFGLMGEGALKSSSTTSTIVFILMFFCMLIATPHLMQKDKEEGLYTQFRFLPLGLEMAIATRLWMQVLCYGTPLAALAAWMASTLHGQDGWASFSILMLASIAISAGGIVMAALGIATRGFPLGVVTWPLIVPVIIFGNEAMAAPVAMQSDAFRMLAGYAFFLAPLCVLVASASLKSSDS
jgi:heme exporter protein CcmB